jgi:hypothetical protein
LTGNHLEAIIQVIDALHDLEKPERTPKPLRLFVLQLLAGEHVFLEKESYSRCFVDRHKLATLHQVEYVLTRTTQQPGSFTTIH